MFYTPVLLVFIPIIASLVVYLFKNKWVSLLVFVSQAALSILAVLYALYLKANPDQALIVFGGWDERIGISFYNDQISFIFIFLTIIIWWVILLYVFKENQLDNKFLFFLTFLQGILLGLIQTNDLFNLFVFIELTTVLVTILIAYKKSGAGFRAGIYYLLLNTVGALFFLIGIILLYNVFGAINIRFLANAIPIHADTTIVKLAFVFMIGGISVKAALVPLFTWLPKAHGVAQSGISALLSGLIVKGALYAFIRMYHFMFAGATFQVTELFFYIGLTTAFIGVMFAITQKDMKQILAYHTVSQVGIMMMGLSSIETFTMYGGILHILNHAFFKSLLFLGAGIIIHTYNTKKVSEVRGVWKTMPFLSILMIVAMLSITGAPLFNGFVSKYMVKYAIKGIWYKEALFFLVNLGTTTSFIKFSQVFFGPKPDIKKDKNPLQYVGMSILALLCVGIGLFYKPLAEVLLSMDLSKIQVFDLKNWFDYLLFVGIGFLFYRYVIAKDFFPIQLIRNFRMTFETANYMFIVYLMILFGVILL